MSKVAVTKSKLDELALQVSGKSGEAMPMTIDEMAEAVEGIDVVNNQSKTVSPSTSSQTVEPDTGYTGLSSVTVNAISPINSSSDIFRSGRYVYVPMGWYPQASNYSMPNATLTRGTDSGFYTQNGTLRWRIRAFTNVTADGYISTGTTYGSFVYWPAIATGTSVTPTESAQTIGSSGTMMQGAVTVNAIPSNYVGSGVTRCDADDVFVSGSDIVLTPGYYDDWYEKQVPLGDVEVADTSITANPSITVGNDGLITAVVSASQSVSPTVTTSGYLAVDDPTGITAGTVSVSGSATSQLTVRDSSDLTASGATVTAPAGYYASSASKAIPSATQTLGITVEYYTLNDERRWKAQPYTNVTSDGYVSTGAITGNSFSYHAIASGTTVTPSESAQTIGGSNYMMEGAVTVNAIPSDYVGSGITQRSSTDLSASGATVSVPAGYYESSASKAIASGSVSASATKGTVSNHSVQVTSTATVGTAGYLSAGSTNGTAVTVSASELVSGSETKTSNGTYDVTNLAELVVNVSGGGSSSMQVGTKTATLSSAASSIQFTGLSGEPTSFVATSSTDQSTGGTKVVGVVYDGTSCHGIDLTTQAEADTGFTQSYSNGTLTVTATTASFQANEYKLVYTYGGTAGNVYTEDVQVGSGATSITFTGLSDEPDYFSCIFKSTFSTSSGYQRVMEVVYDGSSTYGHALDSSAHALTSWTHSYSNGSLTITSTSTNNGGYFHQPGYYQLTAGIGGDQSLQTKTVTPTTSTQNVTADTGYTALKKVTVNPIPSQYIVPTGNIAITSNGTGIDVSQYATASVSVSGGGGATVATKSVTASNRPSSLAFSSLSGQPKMFALKATFTMTSSSSTYYYVDSMRGYLENNNAYSVQGRLFQMGSTRQTMHVTSGYSASWSGNTLTLTSTGNRTTSPGCFYNGQYELVYVY